MKKLILFAFLIATGVSVEAQKLTSADKIELSELAGRWNLYTDAPDLSRLNEYMALWSPNSPTLTNPFGKFDGLGAIKKWQQGYNVSGGPAFGKRHAAFNIASDGVSKNVATVTFDLYLFVVSDIPSVFATSRTTINAVKENGAWKIQKYTISVDPGLAKAMEKAKDAQK